MYTEELSQQLSVNDFVAPQTTGNTTTNSTGIDMQKFKRVMYQIIIGANSGQLDANLQSCFEANFASTVHNMTSTNIAITGSNCIVTIETTDIQVAQQNAGDRYLRLSIQTTNAGNTNFTAVGLAESSKHEPASANDLPANTLIERIVVN